MSTHSLAKRSAAFFFGQSAANRLASALTMILLAVMLAVPIPAFAATDYAPTWDEYKEKNLKGEETLTWNHVADAMDIVFDAAKELYQGGDAEGAYNAVNAGYYGYYETTGFERNAMSYIAGSRKTEVENQFSLCKSYAKKGGTVEEFTTAVDGLKTMIREDARKLDGTTGEGGSSESGSGDLVAAGAFAGAFGIIVREGIEAMLVIGAIIAYLVKAGQKRSLKHVYIGAALGIVCSFIVAWLLTQLKMAGGEQQEIIEGVTALIAVVMLFWVSNWMLSKSETKAWNAYIKKAVEGAATTGSVFALAFTAWLAVFREGAEVVLFLQPLVNSTDPAIIWAGILAGFAVLAIIFIVMRVFSVRLPLKPFFMVMSIIMAIMSISFLGSGINELIEGNVIVGTYVPWVPTGNEVLTVLGINPWVETLVPQAILLFIYIVIFILHFRKEKKNKAAGITEQTAPQAAEQATTTATAKAAAQDASQQAAQAADKATGQATQAVEQATQAADQAADAGGKA